MSLSKSDIESIIESVYTRLSAEPKLTDESHDNHHDFIEMLIEERKILRTRKEKIRTQIIGSSILLIIGSIITTVGYAGIHWVSLVKGGGQ